MRESSNSQKPISLAQHFDAPSDYIGHFGWLCGYSADADFLNDAVERFTRLTSPQRAYQGRIALSVFLDPGNPAISLLGAPGVAHAPIKDVATKPFRLLHAKVALLGFRHKENSGQWQLRLIVSTGNWTRQTLEESLDLAWRVDICSEKLVNLDDTIRQNCADIRAADELLRWIETYFDTRLLNVSTNGHLSETMNALRKVRQWVDVCVKNAKGRARFFDNRRSSLLFQLPVKIRACGEVKRNYLAMGSGFYEGITGQDRPPQVPLAIVKSLRDQGFLTANSTTDLYVNPMACQAIAIAGEALQTHRMTIRSAAIPPMVFGEGKQRSLHAKFLFSANYRDNSNTCNSAWIYLGSGNLTHPGFLQKMGASAGNLEAGVVFAPDTLYWEKVKTNSADLVVTNLLPIHWDDEHNGVLSLSVGSGMEPRNAIYVAPPIAWLTWQEVNGIGELMYPESIPATVDVLDLSGNKCPRSETGFQWKEPQPRQVSIRWVLDANQYEMSIPVIDQYGRIAATKLPAIDIEEAWWQLADFPLPPEDDASDYDEIDGNDSKDGFKGASGKPLTYPIRQMMELIEYIAAKQTGIDEMDWVLWCNRLEQTLGQTGGSTSVSYFRDVLKLNPLSPLRHEPFRPSFAETSDSESGNLYEATLARIEKTWSVGQLDPIESLQ